MHENNSFFSFERGVYWHGLGKMLFLPIIVYIWLALILKTNFMFVVFGVALSIILSILFVFLLDTYLKKRYQQKKQKILDEQQELETTCFGPQYEKIK